MGTKEVENGATYRYPRQYDVDIHAIRKYRTARVRDQIIKHDLGALVLFDPINIRYTTDSSNMQVWTMHEPARYVFIPAQGPIILFDYASSPHIGIGLVDEIRPCTSFFYIIAGDRVDEKAKLFADEITDLMRQHCGGNRRLGVDRTMHAGMLALMLNNIELHEASVVMEQARKIKSEDEIKAMSASIDSTQIAMRRMHDELKPGMTEIELWSILHQENIARGGEWIECRLLSSGPRTNPWFQEASFRKIEAGDMISYDTDCVGPFGYCADISRAFICGDVKPTHAQKEIYQISHAHIMHNLDVVKPGISFSQLADNILKLPKEYFPNRYGVCAHGIGLVDEYPFVPYPEDFPKYGYDGIIEPGMCLCIESYIGHVNGEEGVKLEEQILVTESGIKRLSNFPYEKDLLS